MMEDRDVYSRSLFQQKVGIYNTINDGATSRNSMLGYPEFEHIVHFDKNEPEMIIQ